MPIGPWTPVIIMGLEVILDLVERAIAEEKKSKKLENLVLAWEETGTLKDMLITKYESDKIDTDNKRAAVVVRLMLNRLQELLKSIRKKIQNGEEIEDELEAAKKLTQDIIRQLILL